MRIISLTGTMVLAALALAAGAAFATPHTIPATHTAAHVVVADGPVGTVIVASGNDPWD